jgi:hypothetical protein
VAVFSFFAFCYAPSSARVDFLRRKKNKTKREKDVGKEKGAKSQRFFVVVVVAVALFPRVLYSSITS